MCYLKYIWGKYSNISIIVLVALNDVISVIEGLQDVPIVGNKLNGSTYDMKSRNIVVYKTMFRS